MVDPKNMLMGCVAYLREHPQEILRAARQALHLRFGVPVAALRWLVFQLDGRGGHPADVEIEAVPPGIRVTATVEEMGTLLRGSAILTVEDVRISAEELRVEVRLTEVSVRLLDDQSNTPLAALIRSGALDLSRTANLVAQMPTRPVVLVEAIENRLILDFMRLPLLSADERLRRLVGAISSLLSIKAVETDATHLDVAISALPSGLGALFSKK
jgi:hypothetical protein